MRIAMMVRGYISAPGPGDIVYAPIDLALELSEGLSKLGHQVDFYGPAGTRLNAQVRTRGLRALVHDSKEFTKLLNSVDLLTHYIPGLWDQYLSSEMFKRAQAGEYDILHFHHPETAMPFAGLFPNVPTVYTLHDPITAWWQELYHMYHTPNQFYVSISNNQRIPAPDMPFISTVHNGVSLNRFPFSNQHDNYLLFVGRIVPEKGVDKAVELARRTGEKLTIIGPVTPDHLYYFESKIRPFLNDKIRYLGYLEHEKIAPYYKRAKAFLMPIGWEEPFGLTMIEAMACGTPVIGFKHGAIPEVVVHAKTGFVANNLDEMVDSLKLIDKIDRTNCREHVAKHFTLKQMSAGYEAAYKTILRATRHKNFPTRRLLKRSYHKKWL